MKTGQQGRDGQLKRTAFYSDERCFWHFGGHYASVLPAGGLVQPAVAGGLPENPETKRRLKNLIEVTGLAGELDCRSAEPATGPDIARVHPASYLSEFKRLSDAGGGELGVRAPFGPGGFEIAALSAGLVKAALSSVLSGAHNNAYALSRPPGHHCLPDKPMGFCLLANVAIAIEAARAAHPDLRVAIIDWDVHHGNGTEAIYLESPDVLTVSLHQEHCFPLDTGAAGVRGSGAGEGFNFNLPLPPGSGHKTYLRAFGRIVLPALKAFKPDAVVVACGFDAASTDPLARMLCSATTFAEMTSMLMETAAELCGGRIVMAHEGGYSEAYVPFCGHAVLERLANSRTRIDDPLAARITAQQPTARLQAFQDGWVDDLARGFGFA